MKRNSLYEYTLDELNTRQDMATNQKKYSWYDAAMALCTLEFDHELIINSELGKLSQRKLTNYKINEPHANDVIVTLRKLLSVMSKIYIKKRMFTEFEERQYHKINNDILEIFDELSKYKEFDDVYKAYENYMECVCEYQCLVNLEFLTKEIGKQAQEFNASPSVYDLLDEVLSTIKNRNVSREDVEKLNKIVNNTDFTDLNESLVNRYLRYIKSFSDIVNTKQINKR